MDDTRRALTLLSGVSLIGVLCILELRSCGSHRPPERPRPAVSEARPTTRPTLATSNGYIEVPRAAPPPTCPYSMSEAEVIADLNKDLADMDRLYSMAVEDVAQGREPAYASAQIREAYSSDKSKFESLCGHLGGGSRPVANAYYQAIEGYDRAADRLNDYRLSGGNVNLALANDALQEARSYAEEFRNATRSGKF